MSLFLLFSPPILLLNPASNHPHLHQFLNNWFLVFQHHFSFLIGVFEPFCFVSPPLVPHLYSLPGIHGFPLIVCVSFAITLQWNVSHFNSAFYSWVSFKKKLQTWHPQHLFIGFRLYPILQCNTNLPTGWRLYQANGVHLAAELDQCRITFTAFLEPYWDHLLQKGLGTVVLTRTVVREFIWI